MAAFPLPCPAPRRPRPLIPLAAPVLLALLGACTTVPPAPTAGGSALRPSASPAPAPAPAPAAVPAGAPASAPAAPGTAAPPSPVPPPPAFDTVIKGADRTDAWRPLWKRQDKVWVELQPDDFGRPFFLSPKLSTGLGEAGFFGGLLASRWAQVGRPQWVEFRRLHQQVQLVAMNASFTAGAGTPQSMAVQSAFSASLLASTPVSSAPHPQRGTVLVELSSLFTGDMLGLALQLQRSYRQSYSLDARNTSITQAVGTESGLLIDVQQHFSTSTLATGSSGGSSPTVPSTLPDPRSLFLTVQYTLAPLPAQPMAPRPADHRIGHFTTTVVDFTNDLARTPRQRFVNHWRLEKKDPQAALSEPVRPLVFWLDRSIPLDYRDTIRAGVLAWNPAFEAIGIRNAIEVRDGTADQPRGVVGNGQAIIRWMTNSQPTFGAIGPSHVDPRTGEILTADIALESLSTRAIRAARSQILGLVSAHPGGEPDHPQGEHHDERCLHADLAAEQLGYALDLWAARGELPPDAPEVKAFVLAYLKDTTMHEVGHALGLRHNFKASRWRPNEALNDRALTEAQGSSASVMDYTPINLSAPGQPQGAPFQTTLGPYDFWAIEYAYTPLAGEPAAQQAQLRDIARRSARPDLRHALAYGTDEDAALGIDPEALTFDLGRDPVAFARTRLAIAQDLIARQSTVTLTPDDDQALLRRRISYALRDIGRSAAILGRQVGGLITRRDAPGSGLDALEPLPMATQREALTLLLDQFLAPSSLALPPALQRRLAPDYFERGEGGLDTSGVPAATDFSVANQLAVLQRDVLTTLMNDGLAERLLDNTDKTRDREPNPLTVRELHERLREAVWRPSTPPLSGAAADASAAWRRNLQREHVNRLSAAVLRGSSRADVRAQVRLQAEQLVALLSQRRISRAADPLGSAEAHRRDCLGTLQRALAATVIRSAP